MAELNLKQITDKLNSQLQGDVRKLVFWYDENGEFAEDIDKLELDNAKVLHLEMDNQFYIKHFLEYEDTTTHYLVYAPFPKPDISDNHLEDALLYSKRFFADRSSLISLELGCDERFREVFTKYAKFFANKERLQKFYDLQISVNTNSDIEIGIMSVLCKLKSSNFEEVVRVMLVDYASDESDDNKYLSEIKKYDLDKAFWKQAQEYFGYSDSEPTLEKFILTMFVTYLSRSVNCDLPQPWKSFVAYKSANSVTVYLDNLMNSYLYSDSFDKISKSVYSLLKADNVFRKAQTDDIVNCNLFAGIDSIIIDWLIDRLENEDVSANLDGKSILEVCENRRRSHFGSKLSSEYLVVENAWYLLSMGVYSSVSGINNVIKKYMEESYKIDQRYRHFYYHYDRIENTAKFEKIRQLIENIYTNDYLNNACLNWNIELVSSYDEVKINKQIDFYNKYVLAAKERTVVIISDALRYEVGCSLFEKLSQDEKCKVTIEPMLSVVPSYTRLGMAALLPHRKIELTDDFEVLVDDKSCNDIHQRESILQQFNPKSRCVQYDDLKNMSVANLREIFTNQEVVYIFHNQIDARGDKQNTENEVFVACEEAIEEIFALIKRLTTSANTVRFIVTADHGFVYKRDKISESDKISNIKGSVVNKTKRYVVSNEAVDTDGVASLKLSTVLDNDDIKIVSFPIASDIFKATGGGLNFVHGGSSPQEMLIPLLNVKTVKGHKDTTPAVISLVSLSNKVTNLLFSLDFIQNEPVGSVVKETTYRICFVDENGEKISNEVLHTADNKDENAANRIFKLKFNLRNKQYSRTEKYYLLVVDDKNNLEILRHEVMIDIAFSVDEFNFF